MRGLGQPEGVWPNPCINVRICSAIPPVRRGQSRTPQAERRCSRLGPWRADHEGEREARVRGEPRLGACRYATADGLRSGAPRAHVAVGQFAEDFACHAFPRGGNASGALLRTVKDELGLLMLKQGRLAQTDSYDATAGRHANVPTGMPDNIACIVTRNARMPRCPAPGSERE